MPSRSPEPVVTLGLAVTPRATELVVIRGDPASGAVIDRVVTETREDTATHGSRLRQTVDAVLHTRALAIAHGYRIHGVSVLCDGTDSLIADGLMVALTDAGLHNVALDPAIARSFFAHPDVDDIATAEPDRVRSRHRWMYLASLVIALAALTFAIVDRWQAHPHPVPQPPVVPAQLRTTAPPPAAPPTMVPPQEPAEPPAPAYTPPPRQAPVQRQPAQRPPPPAPPPVAPPEPEPEPAPAENCMFLCGVAL